MMATSAFGAHVDALLNLRNRAERAEARVIMLENLLVAEQSRTERLELEALALYRMLHPDVRPTT